MERTVEAGKIDGEGKIDGRVRAFSQKKNKEPGKSVGAVRTAEAVRSEGVQEN
jgi:hypothetical protein